MKPAHLAMIGVAGFVLFGIKKSARTMNENEAKFTPLLTSEAIKNGIPPAVLIGIARTESHFNPEAVGVQTKYGKALGMMQIMPSQHPQCKNPMNPSEAIPYAAAFLASLYKKYNSWPNAVGAYNAGAGTMNKFLAKKITLPLETQNYIKKVLA
jgi:soluble lytic murein transglycosylase-like protein